MPLPLQQDTIQLSIARAADSGKAGAETQPLPVELPESALSLETSLLELDDPVPASGISPMPSAHGWVATSPILAITALTGRQSA